ncbi:MAG: hypothetical protein QMD71_04705 [bacterium]|nr:hypothetical protein [bacterium]
MNIGMMGGWNTNSGASFHAELIGRAWVEQGHNLRVFTFYDYAFHGTQIVGEDEDYVTRCFTVSSYIPPKLDPIPFLTSNYEIFVVQDLGMLPKDLLAKIFTRIKSKAKVVNVIHDGALSKDPAFYQFDWDAIICFDERYRKFLIDAYEPDKVHIIPYPCYPLVKGDKKEKRRKLGLPENKKIVLLFGPNVRVALELIPSITELASDYQILLLVVTKNRDALKDFRKFQYSKLIDIELREEVPDINRLYDYLHASDALIFNKASPRQVVVSSTASQCLGSGCPIIALNSKYVGYFDKEVMKYSTFDELKKALCSVFDKSPEYKTMMEAAHNYVIRNSAQSIGKRYIELFNSLLLK